MEPILGIEHLAVEYRSRSGRETVRVIDDLDLIVRRGEIVALVGESGSGKSTLAHTIAGLVPAAAGSIRFEGTELVGLSRRRRGPIRQQLQLVFQNALLSLSPRHRVGWQLHEALQVHTSLSAADREKQIAAVLADLDLGPGITDRYPHELSGGQAQRVVLARALILEPTMILFDEPTSALDVSIQAGVLNLLRRLRDQRNLTYLFITHDLGVAHHLADRIAVMRQGEIVEMAPTEDLFSAPKHDYTRMLLASSLIFEGDPP